jgi:ribonuclease III
MASKASRTRALRKFQAAIGVPFRELALLDEALTHSSFINESPATLGRDNQRLEYLGDAILGFVVAEWLYTTFPAAQEGELTSLRALIVRTESLAALGRQLGIGRYLRMGRGEAATGGPERDANLCAAVEALIGAMYLDHGIEVTSAFVHKYLEEWAAQADLAEAAKDAKSRLQEHVQSTLRETPQYEIVSEEGPDHAKIFTAVVIVGEEVWGQGTGNSKQAAQHAAALAALAGLGSAPEGS